MPHFKYTCLLLDQRPDPNAPRFCIFNAPAADVLKWADVRRLAEEVGAPQRQPSPAKVLSIKRFLDQDVRNTIPTAVIITLAIRPDQLIPFTTDGQCPALQILINSDENAVKPGTVIDGQHRLLGMAQHSPDIEVVVVALLEASPIETAFQFLVINNKATKVSTDHIKALVAELRTPDFENRLKTAKLTINSNYRYVAQADSDDESPFKACVNWPSNRDGLKLVLPSAIEAAVAYIEGRNVKPLMESDDNLLEFFYATWSVVKARWGDLWNAESRLMSKVGIVCFNEFLSESLIKLYDWGNLDLRDPDAVKVRTRELLGYQAKEFWTIPWTTTSLDTHAGRQLVVEALVRVTRNMRDGDPWYENIPLIDINSLP